MTDGNPDNPPDGNPDNNASTSTGAFRYPDRFRGPRWARGGADDEGSTWERYQDEGCFPAWL